MSIFKERPIRLRSDKDLNAVNTEKVMLHVDEMLRKLDEQHDRIFSDDFVTDKDIYCKDLITSGESIYIGSKSPENKLQIIDNKLTFAETEIIAMVSDLPTIDDYMSKEVFDPWGVEDNAFDMANMVESADAKILTSAERTDLHAHSNKSILDTVQYRISVGTEEPASPVIGDLWVDTN